MGSDDILEVNNISKTFNVKYTTVYGGTSKLGEKQVLKGLSFNLKKGQVLGIIGRNGCGKSTLLKILTNIMPPDSGSIKCRGSVASILELGMGFDPEASGRDNIRTKCGLYGLHAKEIDLVVDDIVLFSELGDQIDHPLRTYSSGMIAKLAFSVLMYVKSDLLIIDEVLSVGDASFNAKCKLVFDKMKKSGKSIIFASHNLNSIENMCDTVMWIDGGKVRESGTPMSVCFHYQADMDNSFDTVSQLAESGDVSAINRLGEMYRDGRVVEQDLKKAISLFEKASKMGYSVSQVNLADILRGNGDKAGAIVLYQKASKLGNTTAALRLSQLDEDPAFMDKIKTKVLILAKSGNLRAMKLLADMLYNGTIFIKDQARAVEWYKKCAERHDPQSFLIIGLSYRDGIGVERDTLEAIKWLEGASNHGNMRSRLELAEIYRKGIGIEHNVNKAIEWYELSAKTGDSNSMLQLSRIYEDGQGVEADSNKAMLWMKMYANQTVASCEHILAEIIKSAFVDSRQKECIEYYSDAVSRQYVPSMLALAKCYRDGDFEEVNSSAIISNYLDASERMNSNALYELGMMHYRGDFIKQDYKKAISLLYRAALMGKDPAKMQLAIIYEKGLGTTVDLDSAYWLYKDLSEWGNSQATARLLSMLNKRKG